MQVLRYAFRSLRRDVLFTFSTVLTLGLGVGLVTGFFAIVNAVLLRPLAPHGDTVVRIWKVDADRTIARFPISYPELKLWRGSAKSFQGLAAIRYAETSAAAVIVDSEPMPVTLAPVSADFFSVVHGGSALAGRWFNSSDEGNTVELAAVVSARFWRRLSGGDPSFVGRRLLFPGGKRALVVVGVAPDNLEYPNGSPRPPDCSCAHFHVCSRWIADSMSAGSRCSKSCCPKCCSRRPPPRGQRSLRG